MSNPLTEPWVSAARLGSAGIRQEADTDEGAARPAQPAAPGRVARHLQLELVRQQLLGQQIDPRAVRRHVAHAAVQRALTVIEDDLGAFDHRSPELFAAIGWIDVQMNDLANHWSFHAMPFPYPAVSTADRFRFKCYLNKR